MFFVTRRSEIVRFGLFLLVAALLAWFVVGRFEMWRLSEADPGQVGESAHESDSAPGDPAPGNSQGKGAATVPAAGVQGLDVSAGRDYFAEYRIDRERTRGALAERLLELMNSDAASDEVRRQASEQYLALGQTAALESQAEAIVKARGFDDVIVQLAEDSAQVVVKAASLNEQQVLSILDSVSRVTGIKSTAISVMARR